MSGYAIEILDAIKHVMKCRFINGASITSLIKYKQQMLKRWGKSEYITKELRSLKVVDVLRSRSNGNL